MIHYHGTPITPRSVLYELHGRHFCIRFGEHRDVDVCHKIGQSVMIDNGAFGAATIGAITDWEGFYLFVRPYLDFHTTWAVIPDVIGGDEISNYELIVKTLAALPDRETQLAPVWHLHESLTYLDLFVNRFQKVCFGSSGEYWQIGTPSWNNRMNEAFNRICKGTGRPPAWIHMLRGMSLSGSIYPFSSVDSTDVARNHEQEKGKALKMATSWDAIQNPATWKQQPTQHVLVAEGAEVKEG